MDGRAIRSRRWILVVVALAGAVLTAGRGGAARSTAAQAVGGRARQVVLALRARDMQWLARLAHPVRGVRFSPYAYVDVRRDRRFWRAGLRLLMRDRTRTLWGAYDGSGAPIRLTPAEYFRRFVYDRDYACAPQVSVDRRLGRSNTLDNSRQAYPRGVVVEYHVPGTNPKYGGMDWRSLRLVFEPYGSQWYLVAIVHDEWTT